MWILRFTSGVTHAHAPVSVITIRDTISCFNNGAFIPDTEVYVKRTTTGSALRLLTVAVVFGSLKYDS